MAVTFARKPKTRPPLDEAGLEQLALHYVGRYATTKAKLAAYLKRKVDERGWSGPGRPPIETLVGRLEALRYVDDEAFASARAAALGRRGYGERRVAMALKVAGIDEEHAAPARAIAEEGAFAVALRFAERRRIGPFAREVADRAQREKAFAAMIRAGHPPSLARRIVSAEPGNVPEEDES